MKGTIAEFINRPSILVCPSVISNFNSSVLHLIIILYAYIIKHEKYMFAFRWLVIDFIFNLLMITILLSC